MDSSPSSADSFYGPLSAEDLINGQLQVGNFVATGQDLYSYDKKIIDASKLYKVTGLRPAPGLGGFVVQVGDRRLVAYFAEPGEESGWGELFFKATPKHADFKATPSFNIPGAPQNLPEDILSLLNIAFEGKPVSIDKVVEKQLSDFRPTATGDINAYKQALADTLIYLQNIGKIVLDLSSRTIYLTKEGARVQ